MTRSLFVSDIHLTESRNDIITAFLSFLEDIAPNADYLYILGDLFDFWAGDDIETELTRTIAQQLSLLATKGTAVFFQHGNRDFVLGERYARQANMRLIPPFYRVPDAPNIMLLHGDELCLDDISYQRYKRWIRHPLILYILRHLPKKIRLKLANNIRCQSQQKKGREIIDVTESYVEGFFQAENISLMIHGHTHRPAVHSYRHGTRYVLSDWDKKGDYLLLECGKISRHTIDIATIK